MGIVIKNQNAKIFSNALEHDIISYIFLLILGWNMEEEMFVVWFTQQAQVCEISGTNQ